MKLKKINAVLSLLTTLALLVHIGYTVFAYLTFYYNPSLKQFTSLPFMVLCCLHAVCGMCAVFLQGDGTRLDLYPRRNLGTLIQRVSAALIFPLLLLHLNTFNLLRSSAEGGSWFFFALLLASQPLFYAVALSHAAVSLSKALITLGGLASPEKRKVIDRTAYILFAAVFALAAYAVLKGEIAMFVH